ncbi:DUF3750 domain-containing protein [Aliamphritea spongicola]|uniref:DUF3750 domain-containing protein n=1 Tax=Aliamphritea spongicola TaxID=707589 RepID=UPI00290562A4|nr:DUF3750 domain-containing protein [Aliamphritea spongicola]
MSFQWMSGKYRLLLPLMAVLVSACSTDTDWRTASRESAGLAPDPARFSEAVVHVYTADAWGWRGWFATHPWIATKQSGESRYTIYDVIGWRGGNGRPVLGIYQDVPDRHWFGAKPELLVSHTGPQAEAMIAKIRQAALSYPWKHEYKVFPGPNSNTFVAWVASQVPELNLKMPFSAIGSGYISKYKPAPEAQN